MCRRSILFAFLLTLSLWTLPAWGQPEEPMEESGDLSVVLQGLEWGATHDGVVEHFQQQFRDEFRAEIAGIRDPLRVDEIRRSHEDRLDRIRDSYEVFETARTGYEVSVLGGEVAGGCDESMLTVRTDNAQLYYLFTSDQLFKIVVAYNSAYLGGLEFESFLDQVERRYGPPMRTEMGETQLGVRYLARALWQDELTRLRIENRSDLFGTFIMVFSGITFEDQALLRRGGEPGSSQDIGVSDLVRQISRPTTSSVDENVVDDIIGSPTVVELSVPQTEPSTEPLLPEQATSAVGTADQASTGPAEEETTSEEESERDRRRHRRRQVEQEEQAEEEGITIY